MNFNGGYKVGGWRAVRLEIAGLTSHSKTEVTNLVLI